LARAIFVVGSFLLFGAWQQARANVIVLGQSAQKVTYTGLGPDSSGDGTVRVDWGDCTFDGTSTTCIVSGPFTGLGSGGNYNFVLTYSGNGPSPLKGTSLTPGNDLVNFSLSAGSLTFTFNKSDGTSVSYTSVYGLVFTPGQFTCSGNPSSCGPGAVGLTPGATQTGPFSGNIDITPVIQTVISAGSYGGFTFIAPATWIEIYGQFLATTSKVWGGADFQGNNAPTALGGTTVTVGGKSAFVNYVSPNQVNVQVPSDVATGSQPVVVTTVGGSSSPFSRIVNTTQPGLLGPPQFDINNTQYAVALFPDNFYVLPPGLAAGVASRRAKPGDTIILYGIGFGPVTPDNPAGVIDQGTNALTGSLDISIGGKSAHVDYAGLTPGFVGLYQFNVVVPDIPASDTTPLTFTLGGTQGSQTLNLFIGN
jgi:uncharacterized protein (TIGR03437 family)